MFGAVQPKTPDAVLAALVQHGAAIGPKKIMSWEFAHAREAIKSGIYVTLYNRDREHECSRLGKFSRCFCNHLYANHKLAIGKNGRFGKNPCSEEGCKCDNFVFMFRRPEEIGHYHLTRRKGFDVKEWRPLCKCKHPHSVHSADKKRCSNCACSKFVSDFACLSCDGRWEEHEVRYEREDDRIQDKKPVREQFLPLSDVPEIQKEFLVQMKEEKHGGESGAASDETAVVAGAEGEAVEVSGVERRLANLNLPARDKPERSVRLMREQQMLQKQK